MTVRAIQAGAVDFLTKPVNDTDLFDAIDRARRMTSRPRGERQQLASIEEG